MPSIYSIFNSMNIPQTYSSYLSTYFNQNYGYNQKVYLEMYFNAVILRAVNASPWVSDTTEIQSEFYFRNSLNPFRTQAGNFYFYLHKDTRKGS